MSPQMNKDKVSLKDGYWFYLTGNEPGTAEPRIVAFGSALTGKEIVFVNDEIVSSIRSFTRKSQHRFTHEGHRYELAFNMESILTGKLTCSLTKDGTPLAETSKSYVTGPYSKSKILLAAGLGAIFGFFITQFIFKTLM